MFCALSGEVPTEPVVSKLSGHLFEKRLILKHLEADAACPVTRAPMSQADLLDVASHGAVKPRPVSGASFGETLRSLQDEWDALMLETHSLKGHLDATRRELSQALYQHDAACRVIGRLLRERDELRALLESQQQVAASTAVAAAAGAGAPAAAEPAPAAAASSGAPGAGALDEEAKVSIRAKGEELSRLRRKRKKGGAPAANIGDFCSFEDAQRSAPHSSRSSGILHLAMHPDAARRACVSAGADKAVVLWDIAGDKLLSRAANAHSKKITGLCSGSTADGGAIAVTCAQDKKCKVWRLPGAEDEGSLEAACVLSGHGKSVLGVDCHPTGAHCASASADDSWALWDVERAAALVRVGTDGHRPECVKFHPDGLLLATGGAGGDVKIWEVLSQNCALTLKEEDGAVNSVAFSENGYHMATASAEGTVRLWDVRKQKCVHTIAPLAAAAKAASQRVPMAFDPSAAFLAVGGHAVRVFRVKKLESVFEASGFSSNAVTGLGWGEGAAFLAAASLDREALRVFRPQA